MAILGSFTKQPADRLDYDIDYSEWLTAGDGLQSFTVISEPDTLDIVGTFNNTPRLKVWLAGGINKARYKLTVTVTTADSRVKQDEFFLLIKDF